MHTDTFSFEVVDKHDIYDVKAYKISNVECMLMLCKRQKGLEPKTITAHMEYNSVLRKWRYLLVESAKYDGILHLEHWLSNGIIAHTP